MISLSPQAEKYSDAAERACRFRSFDQKKMLNLRHIKTWLVILRSVEDYRLFKPSHRVVRREGLEPPSIQLLVYRVEAC